MRTLELDPPEVLGDEDEDDHEDEKRKGTWMAIADAGSRSGAENGPSHAPDAQPSPFY